MVSPCCPILIGQDHSTGSKAFEINQSVHKARIWDSTHLPSSISSSCLLSLMLSDWLAWMAECRVGADRSLPIPICQDNFAHNIHFQLDPVDSATCDCQLVKLDVTV